MLLHQGGDWIRKLIRLRFQQRRPPSCGHVGRRRHGDQFRMLPFERVQHAVLAISFMTLVWTGFALKYPDSWWARPLLLLEGIALHAQHDPSRSGRGLHGDLGDAPGFADRQPQTARALEGDAAEPPRSARGAVQLRLQPGTGSTPPERSAHSYVEKAEYWAVVWGAIVMVATGLLLWANNLAMRLLPKSWLDVATSVHFYEAVLATLAIVVWHFYSDHFRPRCLSAEHRIPDWVQCQEDRALTGAARSCPTLRETELNA